MAWLALARMVGISKFLEGKPLREAPSHFCVNFNFLNYKKICNKTMIQKQVVLVRVEVSSCVWASMEQQQVFLGKRVSLYRLNHLCLVVKPWGQKSQPTQGSTNDPELKVLLLY